MARRCASFEQSSPSKPLPTCAHEYLERSDAAVSFREAFGLAWSFNLTMSCTNRSRTLFGAVVLLTLALATTAAQGQDAASRGDVASREDFDSTRGLAMGTGARASSVSTAALSTNPAGLGIGRLYHLEGLAGYEPDARRWELGASVVDSMTNKLAAGLAFRGLLGNGETGYSGIDGRLGLGFPLSEAFALGVAGRYLSLTRDGQTPDGEDDSLVNGFTLDASILVQPTEGLRILAFGYNLIDLESALAPLTLGGSAAFTVAEAFSIGGDVLVDLTTYDQAEWTAGGGVEYLAGGQVPLRVGYAFDHGRHVHTVTGGLGYVDQKVGLDLSLAQDVSGGSETRLLAAIRYFVQ